MSRPLTALSYTLPAPIRGANKRSPIDLMPEDFAIEMINLFPTEEGVSLRKGFTSFCSVSSAELQTLAEYSNAAGTKELIVGTDNKIYKVNTGGTKTDITNSATITLNKWQTCNFRATGTPYIILMNGTDQPLKYDGTTLTSAVYTGSGLTDNNLIQPNSFKTRLYAVEKNTTKIWYGASNEAQGALTEFDVGSLLKRGGKVLWTATWTREAGTTYADFLVVASNMGEILVYGGDYPGDASWELVGQYFIPDLIDQRSYFNLDSELAIIAENGILPMSQVSAVGSDSQVYSKLTDALRPEYLQHVIDYKAVFGWHAVVYPKGRMLIVSIPTGDTNCIAHVMNLDTGAWTRFSDLPALTWCVFNSNCYFGSRSGTIYQFDTGYNDNGAAIDFEMRTAFSYLGDRSRVKKFTRCVPVMQADSGVQFNLSVDVDFSDIEITNTATVTAATGSEWDTSDWDTSDWAGDTRRQRSEGYAVCGIGRNVSVRLKGSLEDLSFNVNAFNLLYEPGGLL